MRASLRWLRDLLTSKPGESLDLASSTVESTLTDLGFPVEGRTEAVGLGPNGGKDTVFEVELTSNRGDCLSHRGLARELAARLGLGLRDHTPVPELDRLPSPASSEPVGSHLRLTLECPDACPRFLARVIRGVRVTESPAWLRERLEAVGQRSINCIVDVTNFIALELGNPCHAFDLNALEGRELRVRQARAGERLTTLDGKARTLAGDEIVVADAQRAQSLAGIMGGSDSQVTAQTRDVVLEVATWIPALVRNAARRHQIRTDASHRFERIVDPRTLDAALDLGCRLIVALAGGTICEGMLEAGRKPEPLSVIHLRPTRTQALLGVDLGAAEQQTLLGALGIAVTRDGDALRCTIPAHRPDLTREVDLIEEIARLHGLDRIPVREVLSTRPRPPQATEAARAKAASVLSGLGCFEAVTFSFTSPANAALFLSPGQEALNVDDSRRGGEPTLRPTPLLGLLAARRANANAQPGLAQPLRFYELASCFRQVGGRSDEPQRLALLVDVPCAGKKPTIEELSMGMRQLRGCVEALAQALAGSGSGGPALSITPAEPTCPAYAPGACASVALGNEPLGVMGIASSLVHKAFDLPGPVAMADLDARALFAAYPPRIRLTPLPAFPGTERDLSLIVSESVTFDQVRSAVLAAPPSRLERVEFVTTYRGPQVGEGRKSLTLRLCFRDPTRTLRREEVDEPVAALVESLRRGLGAEIRS